MVVAAMKVGKALQVMIVELDSLRRHEESPSALPFFARNPGEIPPVSSVVAGHGIVVISKQALTC